MFRLMKLELKKNNIRNYLFVSGLSFFILIAFTYFISVVSKVEKNGIFENYNNIFKFTGVISLLIFCTLSAVMFSKFIIEEYKGERAILLFSYPISRKKVFSAKVTVVILFIAISMTLSYGLSVVIFSISESIAPIVNDTISMDIIISTMGNTIPLVFTTISLSIISLGLGFIKKSVPVTIVASFILVSLSGNIISGLIGSYALSIVFSIVVVLISIIIICRLVYKINNLEV